MRTILLITAHMALVTLALAGSLWSAGEVRGGEGVSSPASAGEIKQMNEYDLHTYKFGPASGGTPKQLVILLHGLGSDGRDLIGLGQMLAGALPDAVFVAPDAPWPCDMAPVGYQWFSLQDNSTTATLAGVQRAAPVLDHFISDQMEKYNVPANKVALVGFSQGTMMSLYVGPRFPEKLAGVLGYSGALVGGEELANDGMQKIPVHLIHGDADTVLPVELHNHAENQLKAAGFPVSGSVTRGLAHSVDDAGIRDGGAFLQRVLR